MKMKVFLKTKNKNLEERKNLKMASMYAQRNGAKHEDQVVKRQEHTTLGFGHRRVNFVIMIKKSNTPFPCSSSSPPNSR